MKHWKKLPLRHQDGIAYVFCLAIGFAMILWAINN